jgi:SAM-dependent methyltransferase
MQKTLHEINFKQWSSVSDTYHSIRPVPPNVIIKIILSWLKREPDTVVDVGCGTGLSTIVWDNFADNIIGIEPNEDMRSVAEKNAGSDHIIFKDGVSNETNLPSEYADIITVSQAFHWMDIDSTLHEFYRVLKQDGVLAVYDFTLPPILNHEIEKAFLALRRKCSEIYYSQEKPPVMNDKNIYSGKINAFGKFRFSRETECHGVEIWPQQKIMDFLSHIANIQFAIKIAPSLKKDRDEFFDLIKSRCGSEVEIIFPYKMVMAVK